MHRKLLSVLVFWALAVASASAAPDQWVQIRSDHFTVITNAGEKQGRHVLDQFERMRWLYTVLFPKVNVDPPDPIVVFAAKNEKTFQSFEPQDYLGKGKLSLAGYFLTEPGKNYILLRLDAQQENPFATVYHEYTHLIFRSSSDWIPLWFNEGIAEFFQNTDIQDKSVALGKPSGDDILYLRQQRLIPLPVLLKIDASSPYYHEEEKGSVFYAESWALTHYLEVTDKQKGTHRLRDYLTLMSHHEDSVAAAEIAFGSVKKLQEELESYIRVGEYKQFELNSAAAPIVDSSFTVTPLTQFQADAARADVLASVRREQEARDLIAAILKADPNNTQAMETMGEMELRAGNRDEARKWLGQAVKLDSQSYLANYYYATISDGSEDNAEIESSLKTAIKLNPNFAPAYDRLAGFYVREPDKRDQALPLSIKAIHLDSSNLYFRLNAANVFAALGRFSDATYVLQTALKVARNPGEMAMVQSRIEQVDQMKQFHDQAQASDASGNASGVVGLDSGGPQVVTGTVTTTVAVSQAPKHPDAADGPKHTIAGVIQSVICSYPAVMELQLKAPAKTLALYSNNFTKIDLSALGFTPSEAMSPCRDFQGRNAKVQYAETTDKTVDGQILSIELHK